MAEETNEFTRLQALLRERHGRVGARLASKLGWNSYAHSITDLVESIRAGATIIVYSPREEQLLLAILQAELGYDLSPYTPEEHLRYVASLIARLAQSARSDNREEQGLARELWLHLCYTTGNQQARFLLESQYATKLSFYVPETPRTTLNAPQQARPALLPGRIEHTSAELERMAQELLTLAKEMRVWEA